MRRAILILVFILLKSESQGQNALTRLNYFTKGNPYPVVKLDSLSRDTALINGLNVVWDFSGAVQTGSFDTLYAINPSGTIFYNDPNVNYYLSDVCLYLPGIPNSYWENFYSYYITDTNSIQFIGDWADNGLYETWYYHLTDPEEYFRFPFYYNDSFQDSSYGTAFVFVGGFHWLSSLRSVEADGIGTLVLPNNTYTNCLRLHAVKHVLDNSSIGPPKSLTFITYTWFDLARNGPILEISADSNSLAVNPMIDATYYYDNPLIVGQIEALAPHRIFIYPNPATSHLTIYHNGTYNGTADFYDTFGRLVLHEPLKPEKTRISISGLTPGIYVVRIRAADRLFSRKVVVSAD